MSNSVIIELSIETITLLVSCFDFAFVKKKTKNNRKKFFFYSFFLK